MREDIENVRKRAIIAQRKEEYHRRQDADEPPVKRAKVAEIPMAKADPELVTEDDEEHDLNMIAHYFANNNSDAEQSDGEEQSVKDARSWARLTAQAPCRTQSSWEVFYNTHHPRVMQLYEMLIGAQDESPE